MLFSVGCTKVSEVAVDEKPVAKAEADLSLYIVEEGKSEGPEPVELEEHLNYIDTEELMSLMAGVMSTSTERTAYDQFMPEWNFVLVDSKTYQFILVVTLTAQSIFQMVNLKQKHICFRRQRQNVNFLLWRLELSFKSIISK
ncbi:hypothetical protein KHA80_17410 [Anaerobacillus sp. HL2]|nr:hypothetical protein KHA80_17410 [Anaerobacillus sp. HL2]